MISNHVPPVIQAIGLACVPVDDMPPDTALARKPVAAAVVTLTARDDGHRDVIVSCVTDAREFEWPLPVLLDRALAADAPTIITSRDRDVLAVEAISRRFFVEPRLGALAQGKMLIDPVAMFGVGQDEDELCRRLGIAANPASDSDIARCWKRDAPLAVEDTALGFAVARLVLWAHHASFQVGLPDAFFETLTPLRARLMELEASHPGLKPLLSSRPFHRAASFASDYREYRARRDAGDDTAAWVTFEHGLSYV